MEHDIRELLEEYNDEFIKFRRSVEDTLENLDFDNLSQGVKQAILGKEKYVTGFDSGITDNSAYARMFSELESEISRAKAEIRTEVSRDYATASMLTEFEKSINSAITSAVAGVKAEVTGEGSALQLLTKWKQSLYDENGDIAKINSSIADITSIANANGVSIESLTEWKNEAKTSLTDIRQWCGENGSKISAFAEWKGTSEYSSLDGAVNGAVGSAKEYTDGIKTTIISQVTNNVLANESLAKKTDLATYQTQIDGITGDVNDELEKINSSIASIEEQADKGGAFIDLLVRNTTNVLGDDGMPLDENITSAQILLSAIENDSRIKLKASKIMIDETDYLMFGSANIKGMPYGTSGIGINATNLYMNYNSLTDSCSEMRIFGNFDFTNATVSNLKAKVYFS